MIPFLKSTMLALLPFFLLFTSPQAQQPAVRTSQFTVKGNCSQCKERIETALDIKGVKQARWDKTTKQATVTYNPQKVTVPQLRQAVAQAGHDTDSLPATDKAYLQLPQCCTYRANGGHGHTH